MVLFITIFFRLKADHRKLNTKQDLEGRRGPLTAISFLDKQDNTTKRNCWHVCHSLAHSHNVYNHSFYAKKAADLT